MVVEERGEGGERSGFSYGLLSIERDCDSGGRYIAHAVAFVATSAVGLGLVSYIEHAINQTDRVSRLIVYAAVVGSMYFTVYYVFNRIFRELFSPIHVHAEIGDADVEIGVVRHHRGHEACIRMAAEHRDGNAPNRGHDLHQSCGGSGEGSVVDERVLIRHVANRDSESESAISGDAEKLEAELALDRDRSFYVEKMHDEKKRSSIVLKDSHAIRAIKTANTKGDGKDAQEGAVKNASKGQDFGSRNEEAFSAELEMPLTHMLTACSKHRGQGVS
ncbi:hypothetical protein ANPL_02760 [Anaplasma platys]|uniref:Uncharacterized protein n=1 Tax=Anaplasma platys TaxID=949 RepID=A0A858PYH1_9RICK|nr:hypothetical protein [Anaplasma platys]QJC27614.1 hypothetical protein ANPL_02760 [Anaplasma platys]